MNFPAIFSRFSGWSGRHSSEILLLLLSVTVFSRACLNGFIEAYDDELYVTLNPMVLKGLTAESCTWALTAFVAGNWHPLTLLSHMTDVQLFGTNPFGHHCVSVLLHGLSAVLLFRLLQLFAFDRTIAWLAAAIFAVHPLRVESVAWVAERKDVLSVLFGLAALLAHEAYLRNATLCRYLAVLAFFVLALLSKPMLVTLPLLLLLRDFLLDVPPAAVAVRRNYLLVEKVPFLILAGLTAWVTLLAQRQGDTLIAATLAERLGVTVTAYLEYLRLFFLPAGLSFHYPLRPGMTGVGRILLSLLVLAAITALVHGRRGSSAERFGWWWFLLTLLPVSGIIRFGGQFVADRYTYLPHVGLLIMAAAMVSKRSDLLWRKRVLRGGIGLVLLLSLLTMRQISYWKNGESLYRRAIDLDPENWVAHANLGAALARQERYGEGFLEQARGLLYRGKPLDALEMLQFGYREGSVPQRELEALRREIMEKMR